MTASFETHELLTNLTGLKKRGEGHAPVSRLAGATSAELDSDLAAILTSARAKSASQAVEASQSATIDSLPQGELGAYAAGPVRALPPSYRRLLATPSILIAIGCIIGGAGYTGMQALLTLQAPPAWQEVDPPQESTAQAPASEQTADSASTVAEAVAVAPPSTAKTAAAVEPLAPLDHAAFGRNRLNAEHVIDSKSLELDSREKPASTFSHRALAAPQTPEALVAKPAKPAKERKKHSADKSDKHEPRSSRDAKSKPAKVAKPHEAHGAPAAPPSEANAEPAVVSDARRAAQKITGALKGLVDTDFRARP
ncbi:hypothetical protein [Methylocystis bryophila]|uniref:hypothetical protein n=1 Tax=Methylocystis bryophila TaxID=655015 RepID=UPI001AECFFAC|nr:hypothetical protein [Methylocystis bryophila]BDV40758.1 hypothetical protein DSM21852_40110 [Methylocystis bryophila]